MTTQGAGSMGMPIVPGGEYGGGGATAPVAGRYGFAGRGLDRLVLELVNLVLTLGTCGVAALLGVPASRRTRWTMENITIDGQPCRYQVGWADAWVHGLVSALLWFFTCGIALPWVIARSQRFRIGNTTTWDGRRMRFDGEGIEVLGLTALSWLLLVVTLGLAWPWVAVMWQSWKTRHTIVEDPRAPGGAYRLRFDGGWLSFLVQGGLSGLLVQITLGLYAPWAIAGFQRWAWSATSDELSPPVKVPVGPRTPAQWAVVAGAAAGFLLLAVVILGLVLMAVGVTARPRRGFGESDDADVGLAGGSSRPASGERGDRRGGWPSSRPERGASRAAGAGEDTRSAAGATPTDTAQPGGGAGQDVAGGRPEGLPDVIPRSRTRPPTVKEWASATTVKLEPNGCFRKAVREWLKLNCSKSETASPMPQAVTNLQSMGAENADYFTWVRSGEVADVVLRMVPGRRATASLELQTKTLTIGYDWSSSGEFPSMLWE